MALGGMVFPQPTAASDHPGLFRPGLVRNAVMQAGANKTRQNRLVYKARRASANCAELILWLSQTGD